MFERELIVKELIKSLLFVNQKFSNRNTKSVCRCRDFPAFLIGFSHLQKKNNFWTDLDFLYKIYIRRMKQKGVFRKNNFTI